MELTIYQVDAFTDAVFGGNPAAVCPLETWLDDVTLQAIATENNLSETAFFVATNGTYDLRWFTPGAEVDLCGHATLASAYVVFRHLRPDADTVEFETKSGRLRVVRSGDRLSMDFPALAAHPVNPTADLAAGLRAEPRAVFADMDYLALFDREADVLAIEPDFGILGRLDRRGVIATAPGDDADFVSRFFCPNYDVPEDPVCGSAHCMLTPFWSERLGKSTLLAHQISARGGVLHCGTENGRVQLAGHAVQFLEGRITI
jgi:predicted PhzF superfamily epimerase YddE/YHI9